MSISPFAKINNTILQWARETSGLDVDTAAKKVGAKSKQLQDWEDGLSYPRVKQLRKLAKTYMRPIGFFFLSELPEEPERIKDFRRIPDIFQDEISPALRFEIRLAFERRIEALEISTDLREEAKAIGYSIGINDNSEHVAKKIRNILKVTTDIQFKLRTKEEAFNFWRSALEKLGVLIFQTGVKRNLIVDPQEARGFSISEQPFPVIVVNGKDHPTARCFTLLHEFTHILLHDGGLCDLHNPFSVRSDKDRTEVFCNRVAGSVLVPKDNLLDHEVVKNHNTGPVWNDQELSDLARIFWVSWEVILRRLLLFNRTTRKFYQRWRKDRIDMFPGSEVRRDAEIKIPIWTRVIIKNGKLFPRLVFRALRNNYLTIFEASEMLDAGPHRLIDIENAVF